MSRHNPITHFFLIISFYLLSFHHTFALYNSNSDVVLLTTNNFKQKVLESPDIWLVEFFAPWCQHCKNLAPEWEKTAATLKGVIRVGAVDLTTSEQLATEYGIQGLPTIKVFDHNKQKPSDYSGDRTVKGFSDEAISAVKRVLKARLGPKFNSKNNQEQKKSDSNVIDLTSTNFDELVLDSNDAWLVEFYAPWCGHCKNLKPEWEKAASELKKLDVNVRMGAVDATAYTDLASKYGVRGYPTIVAISATDKNPVPYKGQRSSKAIVEYALNFAPAKISEINELTNQEDFDKMCSKKLCILTFLPHIMDSKKEERNNYIDILKTIGKETNYQPISFFWLEAGAQQHFEELMGLSFGYPATVAINKNKKTYSIHRGTLSEKALSSFINGIFQGKEPTVSLSSSENFPSIQTVTPWDGNDYVALETFDEIPLGDIFAD